MLAGPETAMPVATSNRNIPIITTQPRSSRAGTTFDDWPDWPDWLGS